MMYRWSEPDAWVRFDSKEGIVGSCFRSAETGSSFLRPASGGGVDGVEAMPDDKFLKSDQFHQDLLGRSRKRRRSLKGARDVEAAAGSSRRNDLAPNLELRMVSPASLTASPHRTRKTTDEQLVRVCDSVRVFGISCPILVGEKGEVIDGHIVLEAAVKLRLDEVPVVVCSHLTSTEVRQLRLALNRIAEKGEWDLEALKIEFEELIVLDADIEITGFSKAEEDIVRYCQSNCTGWQRCVHRGRGRACHALENQQIPSDIFIRLLKLSAWSYSCTSDFRSRCVTSKTFFLSAGSTSATKLCGCGGIVLGQCSRPTFAASV